MKNYRLFLIIAVSLLVQNSCRQDEEVVNNEITTLANVDHTTAVEILRLNFLDKYGGVFHLMDLFHSNVFNSDIPCDTIVLREFSEDELLYGFNIPLEISTTCRDTFGDYNDRIYLGNFISGTLTAASDAFAIEVNLVDDLTLGGKSNNDAYMIRQDGLRNILITSGISAEIEPTALLNFDTAILACNQASIDLLARPQIAFFDLKIKTNQSREFFGNPSKRFFGDIRIEDGDWNVHFDDGVVIKM